jgi:serine/threonine protein kinase
MSASSVTDLPDGDDSDDGSDYVADALGLLLSPCARAADLKDRVLGGWKLDELLPHGKGGFGVVYRASHTHLGRGAVKVFCFELNDDPSRRAAFEKEVGVLKRITDADDAPRLVKIYDVGVYEDSLPWIAMSYVEGESLATRLQRLSREERFMPEHDVVSILCDVLRALQGLSAAHGGAAVVHRDITPSNVMVEIGEGVARARLIDFGISRVFDAGDQAAASKGYTVDTFTREYGSPEMWFSWCKTADARSDIFQVGLLGYEMITGRRYWEDEASLWIGAGPYPNFLVKSIKRALDWDRERRFPNAQAFIDALRRPIRNTISPANLRRHPELISFSLCAILLLMLIWIGWRGQTAPVAVAVSKGAPTRADSNPAPTRTSVPTVTPTRDPANVPAPPPGPDVAEQWARLTRIRELHKKLYDGTINDIEFEDLKRLCGQFLSARYLDQSTVDRVSDLRDWILAASRGNVAVTVRQFDNEKYWFRWRLKYVVEAPGANVDGQATVKGKVDTKMKPVRVKWRPADLVTITISELDKGYKGSVTRRLQEPAILQTLQAKWQELATDQDKGLKLWYTIERVDFGPLPQPF